MNEFHEFKMTARWLSLSAGFLENHFSPEKRITTFSLSAEGNTSRKTKEASTQMEA